MSDSEPDEHPDDGEEASEEQPADAVEIPDDAEDEAGIRDGDFVTLQYTARTVDDGTLIDTTDQAVAEEEGIDDEEHTFEPRTIVVGAGHLFEPLEDDLVGAAVDDEGSVVVDAEDAFGEYDEDQVRTVSAEKLDEENRRPGANVEVDGDQGIVETIIGGRARVDFNHPLAGDDIEYEYEIVDVVEDREQQAQELLRTHLDMTLQVDIEVDEVTEQQRVEPDEDDEDDEPEFEEVTVDKETLYVESTPQLSFNQQWMFQKQQIAEELMDRIDVDRVIVQEIIDGSGMGGMMGGMGGMMGGMGGMGSGGGGEALDEADVDADEIVEELEGDDA